MSRQADKGNGFLKDKFGEFQADPPPEVWDAISNQLGGRRRKGLTLIIISAAASLALAVTLGIHYFGNDIPREIELAGEEASSSSAHSSGLEQKVKETMEEEFPFDSRTPGKNAGQEIAGQEGAGRENADQENAEVENPQLALALPDDTNRDGTEEVHVPAELPGTGEGHGDEGHGDEGHSDEGHVGDELTAEEEKTEGKEAAAGEETAAGEEKVEGDEKIEGDEEMRDLILDAGDVGDVDMMADVLSQKEKDPRWVLGAMLSPLYSFRDAEAEALAGTSGQESGILSYATGVQVGYRATRRLAFESGIIYNKMGLSIGAPGIQVFAREELDYAWAGPEMGSSPMTVVTNSVGNIVSYSGDIYVNNYKLNADAVNNNVDNVLPEVSSADEGIRQHLDYLELPFNLRYTLLDKNFKIQVLGGMSTNLLVNNYVTAETASGTTEIGYLTNLRSVNYSGNAGVGFVYHFMKQLSLNVEPRFRYYLNSVNDATLPSTRPYSFGIYTGLNYFF